MRWKLNCPKCGDLSPNATSIENIQTINFCLASNYNCIPSGLGIFCPNMLCRSWCKVVSNDIKRTFEVFIVYQTMLERADALLFGFEIRSRVKESVLAFLKDDKARRWYLKCPSMRAEEMTTKYARVADYMVNHGL